MRYGPSTVDPGHMLLLDRRQRDVDAIVATISDWTASDRPITHVPLTVLGYPFGDVVGITPVLDAPSAVHLAYRPGVPLTWAVWRRGRRVV